jgi:hypothetical protein
VGLGVAGLELRRVAVGGHGLVRIGLLECLCQRAPGPGLAFVHMIGRLQLGGGAQELLSAGLLVLTHHEPEVQVRFEHLRVGLN